MGGWDCGLELRDFIFVGLLFCFIGLFLFILLGEVELCDFFMIDLIWLVVVCCVDVISVWVLFSLYVEVFVFRFLNCFFEVERGWWLL